MPIEITTPADNRGHSFLSETVKNADSEKVLAVYDKALESSLNALAIGVFKALGSRDYGRIDMRLDRQGQPSFIEAIFPALPSCCLRSPSTSSAMRSATSSIRPRRVTTDGRVHPGPLSSGRADPDRRHPCCLLPSLRHPRRSGADDGGTRLHQRADDRQHPRAAPPRRSVLPSIFPLSRQPAARRPRPLLPAENRSQRR